MLERLSTSGNVAAVPILGRHDVALVHLADGRILRSSLQHPLADGRPLLELRVGSTYDATRVDSIEVQAFRGSHTYDILPAGDTGIYWANGIPLRSTLSPEDR